MRRFASLAVAALLLTSGLAPAAAAAPTTTDQHDSTPVTPAIDDRELRDGSLGGPDDDPQSASNNTTRRLELTGSRTGNYSRVSLDFGGTMAISGDSVQNQYHVSLVTLQLEELETQSARAAVVNAYLEATVEELDELARIEERAVERYRTGEITAETLLVQLAILDMRARAITDSLSQIRVRSGSLPRSTLNQIENLRLELSSFQSPARQHVASAATGELDGDHNPMYVTASPNGVVVEMLDDRRYYRNAVRFDQRELGSVDRLGDVDDFQDRMTEIYPWSYASKTNINIDVYLDRNLYVANYVHPQGSMSAFVDGATTDVYREEQSLFLDRLPTLTARTITKDNHSVTVVPTKEGGPFRVNVTRRVSENETEPATDAVVRVDGEVVGTTDSDGQLWVLAPVGDAEVTVVSDDTTINVSAPSGY